MLSKVKFALVEKKKCKLNFFNSYVTHLGCHKFNEKIQNDEEECTRISCDLLLSSKHYLRCIDHYQKIEIKFLHYADCMHFVRCCSLQTSKCVHNMCFYAPIPLHAITVGFIISRYYTHIHIFISDSFRKNHFVHDPRRTQRY